MRISLLTTFIIFSWIQLIFCDVSTTTDGNHQTLEGVVTPGVLVRAVAAQQLTIEKQAKEISQLRKDLERMSSNYESLCDEVRLMSRHLIFHQKTLKLIGDHIDYEHHLPSLELKNATTTEASPVTTTITAAPVVEVTNSTSPTPESNTTFTETTTEKVRVLSVRKTPSLNEITETSCCSNCSVIRQFAPVVDESKPIDDQYLEWLKSLNPVEQSESQTNEVKRQHDYHAHPHSSFVDEMEDSMKRDDLIYATCNVVPNRHISLILQQNVFGVINLWQKKDGQSPVYMHVNVSGFRIPEEHVAQGRRRRETITTPIETSAPASHLAINGDHPTAQPLVASFEHGFHVHTNGDLSRSCQSTGVHFNPMGVAHGGPMDEIKHIGDLGNLKVDREGKIDTEYSFSHISLIGGNGIIGKSLVIHAQADDYGKNKESESSVATGNSGPKIGCCVIEKVDRLPDSSDSKSTIGALRAPASPEKVTTEGSGTVIIDHPEKSQASHPQG